MTAIVAANFDWSIESCDKAPRDLNYERNTEKYGRAMKLTILAWSFTLSTRVLLASHPKQFTSILRKAFCSFLYLHQQEKCQGEMPYYHHNDPACDIKLKGTVKFLNFGMPDIFAVIYLKFKRRGEHLKGILSKWCKWNSKQ